MPEALFYGIPLAGLVTGAVWGALRGRSPITTGVVGAVFGLILVFTIEFTAE